MGINKNIDNRTIGLKILMNAIKMENAMVDILRVEMRILKKLEKFDSSNEDLKSMNRSIRHVLFSLTLVDDRIKTGLELIKNSNGK